MKKYIIALGGLGTIVTPLVSVISCTKTKPAAKVPKQVKQIDLATDKVLSYLQGNKPVLLEALKIAREDSKKANELKAKLVANISSGKISTSLILTFDEKLTKFATKKVIKGIVEKNLKLIAPTGSLKRKGTYGISWVKGDKVIIKNQELGYAIANKGFFDKLDTAMKFGGKIPLAITSFKNMDADKQVIPALLTLKSLISKKMADALGKLNSDTFKLDFKVRDLNAIIDSIRIIAHNIDVDLPAIFASDHKISSLLKLITTPGIILDKEAFDKSVKKLTDTIASVVSRNKAWKVVDIVKFIGGFLDNNKPYEEKTQLEKIWTGHKSKTGKNHRDSLSRKFVQIFIGIFKVTPTEYKQLTLGDMLSKINQINNKSADEIATYLETIKFEFVKKVLNTILIDKRALIGKLGFTGKIFKAEFWAGTYSALGFLLPTIKDGINPVTKKRLVSKEMAKTIDKVVEVVKQRFISICKELKLAVGEDNLWMSLAEPKFIAMFNKGMHAELVKWINYIKNPTKVLPFKEGKDLLYTILKTTGFDKQVIGMINNKAYRAIGTQALLLLNKIAKA